MFSFRNGVIQEIPVEYANLRRFSGPANQTYDDKVRDRSDTACLSRLFRFFGLCSIRKPLQTLRMARRSLKSDFADSWIGVTIPLFLPSLTLKAVRVFPITPGCEWLP
jgi:hypothetical protein